MPFENCFSVVDAAAQPRCLHFVASKHFRLLNIRIISMLVRLRDLVWNLRISCVTHFNGFFPHENFVINDDVSLQKFFVLKAIYSVRFAPFTFWL